MNNIISQKLDVSTKIYDFLKTLNLTDKFLLQSESTPPWADEIELKLFNYRSAATWTKNNWNIPIFSVFVYLVLLQILPIFMRDRDPFKLKSVLFWWNCGLALFSIAGMVVCVPKLLFSPIGGLWTQGLYKSVCSHPAWAANGWSGLAGFAFTLSKIPELVDTLWLLLAKKNPIFLHWYHHITVLLYVWLAYSFGITSGIWFGSMNYCVHAVMYSYYAATQYSPSLKSSIRSWGTCITVLQISQMFIGMFVLLSICYYKSQGKECFNNDLAVFCGLVIYSTYAMLFINFFIKRLTKRH